MKALFILSYYLFLKLSFKTRRLAIVYIRILKGLFIARESRFQSN